MKKKLVSFLIVFILTLTGCVVATPSESAELEQLRQQSQLLSDQLLAAQEQNNTLSTQIAALENESSPQEPVEDSFEGLAAEILPLLQSQDFAALAPFIHPELGVRISPYGYVNVDLDQVFTREQVAGFASNQELYHWGVQAGSGMAINLTVAEYWPEYVTSATPTQEWGLLLDPSRKASNTIDNFAEVYPDGHYVEYLQPGTEAYGYLDWQSLRLGFQQSGDGAHYLSAIIHDEWTP
ncbi:MAG TPA: hypothetical protein PLH64_09715 [Anaerolineaceae bacterium]|nr:hypothetical protein [Anaerolineaceae bacterium]